LNNKISDKDKKDWENFLSSKENLPNKDAKNINKSEIKKITFDFHGYSLNEANDKISDLINEAFRNKVNKLVIVTGKGLHSDNENDPYISKDFGILKYSVPDYIRGSNDLMSMIDRIEDADVKDGGSGAFYIFLKKKL
tara:strand:- start:148 stop:561 length:414 start_codon:yes stop_codon:yes gene_type:complete